MKSITKKAYGKINLILKVGEKRADGRHEVFTVMQKVGLYDTVTVSETETKGIFIECSDDSLATEENLAFKAAKCYFEKADIAPSVKIAIEKRIPVTAGMAGGSTDAGATLTALEDMYGALGFDGIYEMASSLGADVPFFIYEDKTMLGTGTGAHLTPFPSYSGELYGVFVSGVAEKPSTGEMYRILDEVKRDTVSCLEGSELKVKYAIENSDTGAFLAALDNDFELCNPHVTELSEMLADIGAERTLLCGSGPTVCGIFTDKKTAERASEKLTYKTFVCKITGESPPY